MALRATSGRRLLMVVALWGEGKIVVGISEGRMWIDQGEVVYVCFLLWALLRGQ